MNVVLDRLTANIIPFPYASHGRVDGFFNHAQKVDRNTALEMALLQINGPRCIRYLSFDVDRHLGALAWEDANLPIPNIILTNPKNGHAHLIYELEKEVWLRHKNDPRPGEDHPVRFLKAVHKAMEAALKADTAYNGLLVKNPFHASWVATCGRQTPYRLGELSAHLDLISIPQAKLKENSAGRNCTLFDTIRICAYRVKDNFDNFLSFKAYIYDELDRLNDTLPYPLPDKEVHDIGKSVSGWVWNRYTGSGKAKRRGIMGLDPSEPIHLRQQQGQSFTCRIRKEKTENLIRSCILGLQGEGSVISISEVSRRTKISRNTVSAYWSRFSDLLTSRLTYETVSLRDKYYEKGAAPRQIDTLISTHLFNPPLCQLHTPEILTNHTGCLLNIDMTDKRYGVCSCDNHLSIEDRRKIGQRFTCSSRRQKTKIKLREAIEALHLASLPISKMAVARQAKVSRNTVIDHWDELYEDEFLPQLAERDSDDSLWDSNRNKQKYERLKQYRAEGRVSLNAKLAESLRKRVRDVLDGRIKSGSAVRDLGCALDNLREHLETQFQPGMSWNNYGEWEIDHVAPLSVFDLTNRDQFLKACHYSNLQPLWKVDNRSKSNKRMLQ